MTRARITELRESPTIVPDRARLMECLDEIDRLRRVVMTMHSYFPRPDAVPPLRVRHVEDARLFGDAAGIAWEEGIYWRRMNEGASR